MKLSEYLKMYREAFNFTQEQLAEKLNVSRQAISKWENNICIPDIDNLIKLSDLYDISLDELIRGAVYFPKPFTVGKKVDKKTLIFGIIFCIFTSLLFTGFGTQPLWIFLLILSIEILLVLPICFSETWTISRKGIYFQEFSNSLDKLVYLLYILIGKKYMVNKLIHYNDINTIDFIYKKRIRISPLDFSADSIYIDINLKDGDSIKLELYNNIISYIPQVMSYFEKKGIKVHDENNISKAVIEHKCLYEFIRDNDEKIILKSH